MTHDYTSVSDITKNSFSDSVAALQEASSGMEFPSIFDADDRQAMVKLIQSLSQPGWDVHMHQHNVLLMLNKCHGKPYLGCATVGFVQAAPEVLVADYLSDKRLERDHLLKEQNRLEHIDEPFLNGKASIDVYHYTYHAPNFLIKPRDVCLRIITMPLASGAYLVAYRSVKHPMAPESSHYIRAELEVSGAALLPAVDGSGCLTLQVEYLDPKGNIPKMVMNLVCSSYIKNAVDFRKMYVKSPGTRVIPVTPRMSGSPNKPISSIYIP